jgi:hypothetical protein
VSRTKTIEYAGRAVWVIDDALAVLMTYMLDALGDRDPSDQPAWLTEQIPDLRVTAGVSDYGWTIDRGSSLTGARARELIALVEDACQRLASDHPIPLDEALTWKMLDDLPVIGRPNLWGDPINIEPVLELGRAIVALIDGTLEPPPAGTWWCFGWPSGRTTIRMNVAWDEADS